MPTSTSTTNRRLRDTAMLRIIICLLISIGLSGCALFQQKSAAATPAQTADTAYYLCGGCHGPANVRVDFMPPNIIGQKQGYLAAKLRDYRSKTRIAPFMNGITAKLTDQDIDNLANYFAHYPPNQTNQ